MNLRKELIEFKEPILIGVLLGVLLAPLVVPLVSSYDSMFDMSSEEFLEKYGEVVYPDENGDYVIEWRIDIYDSSTINQTWTFEEGDIFNVTSPEDNSYTFPFTFNFSYSDVPYTGESLAFLFLCLMCGLPFAVLVGLFIRGYLFESVSDGELRVYRRVDYDE